MAYTANDSAIGPSPYTGATGALDPGAAGTLPAPDYPPPPPPPPAAPGTTYYNAGPYYQPAVHGYNRGYASGVSRRGPATPAPPPDPWAGIPAGVKDQAVALATKFAQAVGWLGIDWAQAALDIVKAKGMGVVSSPLDFYEAAFGMKLNDQQRKDMPWAEFGMVKDDYFQTVDKLQGTYFDLSGDHMSTDTLKEAIKGNWTPQQMTSFLIWGSAQGGGSSAEAAQRADKLNMPWLTAGGTYTQARQQYASFYGTAPDDKFTLAAWWRFGTSAKQITGAPGAVWREQLVGKSLTEVR